MKKTKIGDLSARAIHSVPRTIDWTDTTSADEDEGLWRAWSINCCEKCSTPVRLDAHDNPGGDHHCDIDTDEDPDTGCNGWVPLFEGPMMNYWYPLGVTDLDESRAIDQDSLKRGLGRLRNLPVCLVLVGGEYGLALTGGGMDLSWEICEAFVELGYLPPIHFADLPQMWGRGASATDQRIMKACRRSIIIGMRHLRNKLRGLSSTGEWAKKNKVEIKVNVIGAER